MEKKSAAAATSAVSQASDSAHSATVPADAQSSSGAAQATASAAPQSAKPASRPRYCVERDSGSDSIRSSSLSLISRSVLEATCAAIRRLEEHTSELQSLAYLVCRLLLEKKKIQKSTNFSDECVVPGAANPARILDVAR